MFRILNTLYYFEKRYRSIDLKKNRCTRAVTRLSKCTKCREICPTDSIKITNTGIEIGDNCINCGMCASVCPSFAITLSPVDETTLFNLLKNYNKNGESGDIFCHKNAKTFKNKVPVTCLGNLSIFTILAMLTLEHPPIFNIDEELCRNCHYYFGIEIFKDRLNKVTDFLNKIEYEYTLDTKSEEYVEQLDRRGFFKSLISTNKDIGMDILNYIIDNNFDVQLDDFKRPVFEFYFKGLIDDQLEKGNADLKVPFVKVPEVTGNCNLCKACVKLCPAKLLKIEEDSLKINYKGCLGCGICRDVCFRNAMSLDNINIGDAKNDDKTLASVVEKTCISCKFKFKTSTDTDICLSCAKE